MSVRILLKPTWWLSHPRVCRYSLPVTDGLHAPSVSTLYICTHWYRYILKPDVSMGGEEGEGILWSFFRGVLRPKIRAAYRWWVWPWAGGYIYFGWILFHEWIPCSRYYTTVHRGEINPSTAGSTKPIAIMSATVTELYALAIIAIRSKSVFVSWHALWWTHGGYFDRFHLRVDGDSLYQENTLVRHKNSSIFIIIFAFMFYVFISEWKTVIESRTFAPRDGRKFLENKTRLYHFNKASQN